MKYELSKIESIVVRLREYRDKRYLSTTDFRKDYKDNILKLLEKYVESVRTGKNSSIDILCDMCILWLNCDYPKSEKYNAQTFAHKVPEYFNKCDALYIPVANIYAMLECNALETPFLYNMCEALYMQGLNPYTALGEKINELDSVTGVLHNNKFAEEQGANTYFRAFVKATNLGRELGYTDSVNFNSEDNEYWFFYIDDTNIKIKIRKWYKADYNIAKQFKGD